MVEILLTKNLSEQIALCEKYAYKANDSYARSLSDNNCSDYIRNYYRIVAKNYYELKETLFHIEKYGSIKYNPLCITCRTPSEYHPHFYKMFNIYNKYNHLVSNLK